MTWHKVPALCMGQAAWVWQTLQGEFSLLGVTRGFAVAVPRLAWANILLFGQDL